MHNIILGATLAIGFLFSQDGHMLIVLNQTLLSLTPFSAFPLHAFGICVFVSVHAGKRPTFYLQRHFSLLS